MSLPENAGGPLRKTDGVGQCFTPDALGALMAAAYHWSYFDASFPLDVRRRALEASFQASPDKNETINSILAVDAQRMTVDGFQFTNSVSGNRAGVLIYFRLEDGTSEPLPTPLIWTGTTWQVAMKRATEGTSGPRVDWRA
ncbi:hypothetical protein CGZ93_10405 [Enemella dayhoffiae]|uniref:DUF8175 domain-containing protein n=1 Tax=Enemella dayhoffiae TaxID=2016507 RepID=A0A255H1D6_9ACTN|nr:hypothetical protein [Enemella dayhoffiae]OYO21481.1 hypothetical protein CGZ93_10405 [Enemella dayhoffiae]